MSRNGRSRIEMALWARVEVARIDHRGLRILRKHSDHDCSQSVAGWDGLYNQTRLVLNSYLRVDVNADNLQTDAVMLIRF